MLLFGLGVAMIASEAISRTIYHRIGFSAHLTILGAGLYLAGWGVKQLMTARWPRLLHRNLVRHQFRIPREGQIFLAMLMVLFIGSMLGRSNGLLLVFCALAGPFIINGGLIFSMLQHLVVTREAPARMMAGECISVEIRLKNTKRYLPTWMMIVRDRAETLNEVVEPEVLFVHVPRGGQQVSSYRLSIATRGIARLGPVTVLSRFPLGLVERGLQYHSPSQILVYPRIGRLTSNWRRMTETTHASSRSSHQSALTADTFHALRDYHSGDDPRTIHWRSTARRNELIVREFRDQQDTPVVLLIDAWRAPEADAREDHMELAISFSATVCVHQLHSSRDAPVALAAAGDNWFEWNEISQRQPVEELLDGLAILETSPTAEWERLVEFAMRIADRRQTVLLLTPRPDVIRDQISGLRSRHGWERDPAALIRIMPVTDLESSRVFSWA